ncbi:glycosyltransferase [uncultured Algibacter sp.]|uniref:glycosyltransferase n=1 Tax=uncultured Algibacter sp. TaxID=298659 RepID=UPI003216AF26
MKILRVISSMHPKGGGPCQGIRNSIPALKEIGVDNEVVCLDNPKSDYLGTDSFVIHAIGPAKGPWAYTATLIPWLEEKASNFDLIIVHGLWQFSSFAVYKAMKKLKTKAIPYFVMPHGMLDPYFQKAPERRLKAFRNWMFWKVIESKVVNNANGVLFTCQEELLLAREAFTPYRPKKELNVGYGIQEPPTFQSDMITAFKAVSKNLDKPYLLFLSRIHQKKGLDLLLNAYADWVNTVKHDDEILDLVIAGPGMETAFGNTLKKIVEQSQVLKKHIHFTGMLTGDAKWGAFYGAEAFILPSHQENFGIAIVEALASSKPVLISNKVNIWREIEADNAGFIAEDTQNGALSLLNKWGALSDNEKKDMSSQAKASYIKHYNILSAAKRLAETLKNEIK